MWQPGVTRLVPSSFWDLGTGKVSTPQGVLYRPHMAPEIPPLTLTAAFERVRDTCLASKDADLLGIEVEWLTSVAGAQPTLSQLEPPRDLPGGGRVTFEPGGQIEISSQPGSLDEVIAATQADATAVRDHIRSRSNVETIGSGLDMRCDIERILDAPRYEAMESYFDRLGEHGRIMMRRTAAIQVNIGVGDSASERWHLASHLGPLFAAIFANSPTPTHRSGRLANWLSLDPTRTSPVAAHGDPRDAWAQFALDANVMLIQTDASGFEAVREDLPFKDWISNGYRGRFPTEQDLTYHLTTLFPPVRARGWLELRMIDALPDPFWPVPLAIIAAILQDENAAGSVQTAAAQASGRWETAAEAGLTDSTLASAARECFTVALEHLGRRGVDVGTRATCEEFFERYTIRGRSPADDVLDKRKQEEAAA